MTTVYVDSKTKTSNLNNSIKYNELLTSDEPVNISLIIIKIQNPIWSVE